MAQSHTYTSDHNVHSCNFSNSNGWSNYIFADAPAQPLTWLSPLDPSLRHREIQERRVNDIGEWLIHTEEFRRWCEFDGQGEGDKGVLFCNGDPGVGKTFMSSLVVDSLCDQTRGRNTVVSFFYFDFRARGEQTAISMLGSLVKQMVRTMETIPKEILRVLEMQKRVFNAPRLQIVDLVEMLRTIASSLPTFICIDAVDECTEEQRFLLLNSLKQILQSPGTRIFMTGRPHILAEVQTRLAGQVISISISPPKSDIKTYLHSRLGQDETPDAMDKSLEAKILERIPENISGSFLLASSSIEAILNEPTISGRRKRLKAITLG